MLVKGPAFNTNLNIPPAVRLRTLVCDRLFWILVWFRQLVDFIVSNYGFLRLKDFVEVFYRIVYSSLHDLMS